MCLYVHHSSVCTHMIAAHCIVVALYRPEGMIRPPPMVVEIVGLSDFLIRGGEGARKRDALASYRERLAHLPLKLMSLLLHAFP